MLILTRKTIIIALLLLVVSPVGVNAHEEHAPHHWESMEVRAQLSRQAAFLAGAFLFVVSASKLIENYRRQTADERVS